MSGIGGLLRFDGRSVERAEAERMMNALRPHGPDRANLLRIGSAGFVHTLMRFTAEDSFDNQPYRGAAAIITADLRIDNRAEICERLQLNERDVSSWSDARLVLHGWERLGQKLWPVLRGPFAVAIYRPADRSLTLARDHLGLNTLVWYRSDSLFAFATMPKGLFAIADVPRELSEEKLADFLVLNHAEHETTIYRAIHRLPPAHRMTVDGTGRIASERFWGAHDIRDVRLSSDEEYAEATRAHLDRAVRRQLRAIYPIGSHLTGGLDSSSVAALAARALAEKNQRLATYTSVPKEGFAAPQPPGWYPDERPYVRAIADFLGNVDVNYVRTDEQDDFRELERLFPVLESPMRNPTNLGWLMSIARLARSQNRRVLLSGNSGNFSISWAGWSQAAANVRRGRLATALGQWRQYYAVSPDSVFTSFRKLLIDPLVSDRLVRWSYKRKHGGEPWQAHAAINPHFAIAQQVDARAQRVGHDFLYRAPLDTRAERLAGLTSVDYAGDWNAAFKAQTGVETRDPTADVDLVEFCLGVPDEQYLVEDIDRSLVRRAMWGYLPGFVLANRMRGMQSADWFERLQSKREELSSEIDRLRDSSLVARAIDLDRLKTLLDNWPRDGWHKKAVVDKYHLALTRGIGMGKFISWIEGENQPARN